MSWRVDITPDGSWEIVAEPQMPEATQPKRETLSDIITEMREWGLGEGCFNDNPEGEPFPCVYWSRDAYMALCDRLEAVELRSRLTSR